MASVEESGVDRWFFGGGAEHTPESARRLLYTSTGGAEGIGGVNDLKILPLAIPGQGVRVAVGAALIRSQYVGGATQTYQGCVFRQQSLEIAPNQTNSARADLVILRVEDPFAAGSTFPVPSEAAAVDEQYIYARVVSGVPKGATRIQNVPGYENSTAVTLARIELPAYTGTVTTANIIDLREVAQPRALTEVRAYNLIGEGTPNKITAQIPNMNTWPSQAETAGVLDVDIPAWATVMKIVMTVSGFVAPSKGNSWGRFQVQVGPTANANHVKSQETRWSVEDSSWGYRGNVRVADTLRIPTALRGTRQRFYPRANRESGTVDQAIYADWATCIDFSVTFQEQAD